MPRDNLLNSACLELFETIRRENVKPVILHLVENYRARLEAITYVDTFRNIVIRYEQLTHPAGPTHSQNNGELDSSFLTSDADTPHTRRVIVNGGGSRWQGLKDVDVDEEAYFNTSDGDDDDEDELSIEGGDRGGMYGRTKATRWANGASPLTKPLVDYIDDDEDNDTDEFDTEAHMEQQNKTRENDRSKKTFTPTSSAESIQSSPPTPSPSQSQYPIAEPESPTQPQSSPTLTSTPPTPITNTSTSTLPKPPSHLSEKRRRASDSDSDDDELSRLASSSGTATAPKRRLSNTSNLTALSSSDNSWDLVGGAGASDSGSEAAGVAGEATSTGDKAAPRHGLRRKRAFGPSVGGKESGAGSPIAAGPGPNKKIVFSIGAGAGKNGKE